MITKCFAIILCLIVAVLQFAEADYLSDTKTAASRDLSGKNFKQVKNLLVGNNRQTKSLHALRNYDPNANSCQNVPEDDICGECRQLAGIVLEAYGTYPTDYFQAYAVQVCLQAGLGTLDVCNGLVQRYYAPMNVIVKKLEADAYSLTQMAVELCGESLQANHCKFNRTGKYNWNVPIQGKAPTCVNKYQNILNGSLIRKPIRIDQYTDIHLQLNYTVGSNANCNEPNCCRPNQNNASEPGFVSAGKFGSTTSKCDVSPALFESFCAHVAKRLEKECPDYVYVTGDMDSHEYWSVTASDVSYINQYVWERIEQLYKKKCPFTKIYVIFGNHDKFPCNLVPPIGYTNPDPAVTSAQATYDLAARIWPRLAQDLYIRNTIKTGGYYSTKLRDGLMLIVLDSNPCYTYNFWLVYQPSLMREQLIWFENELFKAECKGQKVHVLAHIPPKEDSFDITCAIVFQSIIERYQNTITNTFAGHTHYQDLNLQYSRKDPTCLASYVINGGSLTSWNDKLPVNPNYITLEVDPVTFEVTSYRVFSFDIETANKNRKLQQKPEWKEEANIPEDYKQRDLSLKSLRQFYVGLPNDSKLVDVYCNTAVKGNLSVTCDHTCKADLVASISQTVFCENSFGELQAQKYEAQFSKP